MANLSLLEQLSSSASGWFPILLDLAAKGAVILILTSILALTMRRAPAATRHMVWLLGTCSLLVLPVLSATLPGWHILPQWTAGAHGPTPVEFVSPADAGTASAYAAPQTETSTVESSAPPPARVAEYSRASTHSDPWAWMRPILSLSWQAWALLAWASGALLLLVTIASGYLSLRWLEHRSVRITDEDWLSLLSELRTQLGIHRPVGMLCSAQRTMPMTWGLWRTRVLLPADAESWSPEQRRAVLLHELAHAKRWDCLWQLAVQLTCALYWFNPLIWLSWHRIQTERERACDDLVLRTGTKPSAYAEQLLHIAEEMPTVRYSAAAIAMARPGTLEGRLLAILDSTRNRRTVTGFAVVLGIALLSGVAVPLAMLRAGAPATESAEKTDRRVNELIYVLRHSTRDSLQDQWCAAIKELTEIGKPAVPALVTELDHTDGIFEKSAVAFTLRAIGDLRAVPALIRALPRSVDQIGGFGLTTANEDIRRFMIQHAGSADPYPGHDIFSFDSPLDELDCSLRKITGHSEGKIYPDTDSPAEQAAAAAVRREMAKRWTKWWTENRHKYVSDAELATVENRAAPQDDPVEAAGLAKFGPLFPAGKDVRLGPVHDLVLPAGITIDVKACLNFDTGRTFGQLEGSRLNVRADWLRWYQETGVDARVTAGEELVGYDVRAWLVDNVLWDKLPDELATRDAIDPGIKGPSSSFYPCRVEGVGRIDAGTLPATFLVITREGSRGILQILSQETPPNGLHIWYRMFESPRLPAVKVTTLPTQPARAGLSFGAEHQVTLHDPRSKMDAAVSFDTGETFALPDGAFAAGYEKWLHASDASVMAWVGSDPGILAGVLGNKIGLRQIASEAWDRLTPAEVIDLSSRFPPSSDFAFQALGVSPSLPQTGVFQTAKGTMGLVQITEANGVTGRTSPMADVVGHHPTTLKLRYKVVQGGQRALGSERPVSSPATRTAPQTSAVLPGDNTVELLAISPYPDPQNTWWLPDGSPSPRRYETREPGQSPWPEEGGRRFLFHFSKATPSDAHLEFRFSTPRSAENHYNGVHGQDLDKPFVLFTAFPTNPKNVTIRMGEASGPWKSVATYDARTGKAAGDLPAGFVFRDAKDNGGSAEITVARPTRDLQLRLVAVDADGGEHQTDMAWIGDTAEVCQDYWRFDRMPLASISFFRLESREYQWVEFQNIANEPGLQIAAAVESGMPATTVPVAAQPAALLARPVTVPTRRSATRAAATQATHPFTFQDLRFLGDVLKVDDKSITISLKYQQGIRRPAATTKTFVLDKQQTRAAIATPMLSRMTDRGIPITTFRTTPIELSELKVGQNLAIAAGGDVATHILVLPPGDPLPMASGNPREPGEPGPATRPTSIATGNITKLDGNSLTVDSRRPGPTGPVTVLADDNSQVMLDGQRAYLDDLKERMFVDVTSFPATARFPAKLLISASSPRLSGTVVRLDGRNVIVRVTKPDGTSSEVTVPTNDQTKITVPGTMMGFQLTPSRSIHLEELVEGTRVRVLPETGTAERIDVLPARRSTTRPVATQPSTAEEGKQSRPRMPGPSATVVKVEEGSITVKLFPTDTEGAKEVTVAIQKRTMVSILEVMEEMKTEDGRVTRRYVFKVGKLGDVKVGQRVNVIADDEGAREIQVWPEPPKTENGKLVPSTPTAQTRPTGRAWLGIQISDIEGTEMRQVAESFGYTGETGILVQEVFPGSPADGILRKGDILTEIDGEKLTKAEILRDHVASAGVGGKVLLTIFREKKIETVSVTVGAGPAAATGPGAAGR